MRCEYCTRRLGANEIVTGIRYGITDNLTDAFIPARDSAPTIICNHCSEILLKLIYTKLNKTIQPSRPHNHYR